MASGRLNVQQVVDKWSNNGANSGPDVKLGVDAVTESPMEKAAQKADAYLAGVQRAVASGKYAANLRKVSLSDWKAAMIKKGIPNMATGYRESKEKFRRFMTDFLPYTRTVSEVIKDMPKGTLQQGKDRMMRVIDMMADYPNVRGG